MTEGTCTDQSAEWTTGALFVLVDGIGLAAGHQYDRAPGRKGGQRFVRNVEQ